MSYRLIKLWDNNPKAAAKESSCYIIVSALFVLIGLSDGLSYVPNFWYILLTIFVAGFLIWACFYYANIHQEPNEDEKDDNANKDMRKS